MKTELRSIITDEERFRKKLETECERTTDRKMLVELEEDGNKICITNFDGTDETITSLLEKGFTSEICERIIDDLQRAIKMSKQKEKFYRYVFLRDIENATKYHTKLSETWFKTLEDVMEHDLKGGTTGIHISQARIGEQSDYAQQSEAVRLFADEMKMSNEHREHCLEVLKGL
jgi:hypothetical protein|tara:strand:+ start:32 stop:553 length:522 start_codon:yes stop_codon:yes gene_type:complete